MLTIFWESLSGVLVILIMVVCGFVMNERHWFSPQSPQIISKVVTQVALPTYMIATITKQFTTDQLKTLLPDLRYPVISMLILFCPLLCRCPCLGHPKEPPRPFFVDVFQLQHRLHWPTN